MSSTPPPVRAPIRARRIGTVRISTVRIGAVPIGGVRNGRLVPTSPSPTPLGPER